MGERTDDLDAELEELVDDGDAEEVSTPANVDTGFDDLGLETDRTGTREVDPGGRDAAVGASGATASEEPGRIRSWLGSLFSTRWFGVAAIASGVGVFGAGAVPLPFTGYLGIILAGAAIGLVGGERRYLEVAAAGALAASVATFLSAITLVLFLVGVPYVAVAAVLGAVAAAIGHYAGRDLRHGLTRDL